MSLFHHTLGTWQGQLKATVVSWAIEKQLHLIGKVITHRYEWQDQFNHFPHSLFFHFGAEKHLFICSARLIGAHLRKGRNFQLSSPKSTEEGLEP